MVSDLQKASLLKRLAAGIFDGILLCILAVGAALLLSAVLNYNNVNSELEAAYDQYENQYGVEFDISGTQYDALTDSQRQQYDEAYKALTSDEAVLYTYNLLINLTLLITTFGILLAVLILEFVVPLWLKNGQTIGKKIFGIGLMRSDGVQMNNLQLFTRTVLGKFTIEIMIPVYIVMMIAFNSIGITGTLVLGLIVLVEIIALSVTRTNSMIHDLLAGTVAVDLASQTIFRTTEDLLAYKKKLHAEQVSRADY